jgi:hypothetical protein
MMNTCTRPDAGARNPELGAIAIVVAALWMTLFGLAAFAVDIGYGYTNKRGLKAVADAAVRAAMPVYTPGNPSAAVTRVNDIAAANGYSSGVAVSYPATDQLRVRVELTQPFYFLKLFGMSSKVVSAYSTGELLTTGGAAIHAHTTACGAVGFWAQGAGTLTINGSVESNADMTFGAGMFGSISGSAKYYTGGGCTASGAPPWVTAFSPQGSQLPDPFAAVTTASFPPCTYGSLAAPYSIPFSQWVGNRLPAGVYCSGGDLAVSDPTLAMFTDAATQPPTVASGLNPALRGATFIATGRIAFGSNNGASFRAFPGSPNGIFAMATGTFTCASGTPSINLGNAATYTINGSMYAPTGCINAGGMNFTITNGQVVGSEVNLGLSAGGVWTISGGGGGGGSTWRMVD